MTRRLLLIACTIAAGVPLVPAAAEPTTQAPTTTATQAATQPATQPATAPLTPVQRWQAAQSDAQAKAQLLVWMMEPDAQTPADRAAVLHVMDGSDPPPDAEWVPALIAVLKNLDEPSNGGNAPRPSRSVNQSGRSTATLVGSVLSQIDNAIAQRAVIDLLQDERHPADDRMAAAYALAPFQSHGAAEALLTTVTGEAPAGVQAAAYESLRALSGRFDLPDQPEPWQNWWRAHRTLNKGAWQAALLRNVTRHAEQLRQQREGALRELVTAKRTLYRTAARDKQQDVLIDMLASPQDRVRRLALELAVQGLVDGRPFDEPLRDAIRRSTADDQAGVRRAALLLLRDLGDAPAAERVAQQLNDGAESDPDVLRAALVLLAGIPREAAVAPALAMLLDGAYRNEAAAFLAAAAERDLLDPQQVRQARARAVRPLDEGEPASPQVVTLLSRVGNDEDWSRIADWIDSERADVQLAAAEAWARSDRSLKILADRLDDPEIQPITFAAAIRRGSDPFTLLTLVETVPSSASARDNWQRALVAMAGRVPAQTVAQAVQALEQKEADTQAARELMLSSAISQAPPLVDDPSILSPAGRRALAARLALHLQRAALRRDQGDYNQAANDYAAAVSLPLLPLDQHIRGHLGLIQTALRSARPDDAIAATERLVTTVSFTQDHPLPVDALVAAYTAAADRAITARQTPVAGTLLRRLVSLLENQLTDAHRQRIAALQERIDNPPTTSDNGNSNGNGNGGGNNGGNGATNPPAPAPSPAPSPSPKPGA